MSVRQINYRQVNGQVAEHPCPACGSEMNPDVAWWWTWHGACCTEGCAQKRIAGFHGTLGACDDACRPS